MLSDWELYLFELMEPSDIKTATVKPQYMYIGQYPNFSLRSSDMSPYGSATYRLTIVNKGEPDLIRTGNVAVDHEVSTCINSIDKKCRDVQSRVSDLGQLTKEDAIPYRWESVSLRDLLKELYDNNLDDVEVNDISFTLHMPDSECLIKGDKDKLKRAFENLLYNAIGFTPDGGSITIDLCCEGREAVVQVADTGQGIKKEDLTWIFDRYYTSRPQGHGIGLYIVRSTIADHGGTVTALSEQGKGSVFIVRLPLMGQL